MTNNEMDDMPYAKNYGTAKNIYSQLRNAIYDVLFDLNLDKSIYISNESEASSLANTLAVKCCNTLDNNKYIQWENGKKPLSYDTRLDDVLLNLEAK